MAPRFISSPTCRTRPSAMRPGCLREPRSGAASWATASRHGRCSGASDRKMPPAIPIATYRLQLSADFDFDAAAAVVPYLKALGITHLYASPFMRARKGSAHGYDVTDHAQFNPELGGDEGSFAAWYFEHRLPVAPERYGEILRMIIKEAGAEESAPGKEMLGLASRYTGLRRPIYKEAPAFRTELKEIPGGAEIIARGLSAYRAGPDRTAPTLALHHLLERQHYKLGHWRLASSDINYRRFFDINTLAGLRVEDAGTFEAIHRLVKRLIAEGKLDGLRLDHIDGLRDPVQYFQRLRRLVREAHGGRSRPFYVVIEKILGEHEKLPSFAGVHGTTGYEWMNAITQVLTDCHGLEPLDEIWRQVSNQSPRLEPILREAKRRVLETLLTSEFTVLTRLLARIASGHYSTRDYSADSLRQALELYVLHFPVYRTYLTSSGPSAHDRELISETIERARADWFAADDGIFDFLRDTLTMDLIKPGRAHHSAPRVRRFALKVQQFTGPMMAKSLEDTTFYRYHRLLAFNEVGGDPAAHAMAIADFHERMTARAAALPHGLTATATHDTKRGEDARARLLALAELADDWSEAVRYWRKLNARLIDRPG